VLTGDEIDGSSVEVKSDNAGLPVVTFRVKGRVQQVWGPPAGKLDAYFPVALDKRIVSVPRVTSPLEDGRGTLRGLTPDGAQRLARYLRLGSLPTTFHLVETRRLQGTPIVPGWR